MFVSHLFILIFIYYFLFIYLNIYLLFISYLFT